MSRWCWRLAASQRADRSRPTTGRLAALLTLDLQPRHPPRVLQILLTRPNTRGIVTATTLYATEDCFAAGTRSLPVDPGHSGDRTPLPDSQTIVELTWQTADTRLTLQTDSSAMVEAAEWSAAVSRDPCLPDCVGGSEKSFWAYEREYPLPKPPSVPALPQFDADASSTARKVCCSAHYPSYATTNRCREPSASTITTCYVGSIRFRGVGTWFLSGLRAEGCACSWDEGYSTK